MPRRKLRPLLHHGAAVLAVAVAVLLGRLLGSSRGEVELGLLHAAVAVAVWYGGAGPALLATALGGVAGTLLGADPAGGQAGASEQIAGLLGYLLSCSIIVSFGHAVRVARRRSFADRAARRRVEQTISVVWTWSPGTGKGEYDKVQAWWQELTGQSPEAQHGTGWLDFVHPDDRDRASAAWIQAMTSGGSYETEYRVRTRTGEYRRLVSRAVPIGESRAPVHEWVGMLVDVTEQQRAKGALRQSEELLQLIIDSVPALIAYIDADCRYRLVNRSYERWFGMSPEQICGRHVREVIGEGPWRAVEPHVRRALAGEEVTYEQELDYRGAGRRWVRATYTPDRDPQGHVHGFAVLVNDITDRKQIEDALEEADRRRDEFLATLAHELRNPLAPIRSSLQLLKTPAADPALHERARDMMERQLHHLVRLVDDLLDVSRIMRSKIELRTEVVALDAVIARALETAQPLIDAQRHSLIVSLPDRPVTLNADPVRLAQVIGNLLTNAAKYTEPGGNIRVAVERSGSDALIRVRDDGIGIEPDMQSRIFELFVQVNHSTARAQGGLGIGLTLVQSLVVMHHGSVEVHSAGLGTGSEIIVRLPALPDAPAQPGEMARPPESRPRAPIEAKIDGEPGDEAHGDRADENQGQRPPEPPARARILVVDDNTDAGETLAMLLDLYGHEVEVVGSGMAALELIPSFRPDVIFLDIGMPVMDGFEVARRLRELPAGERVCLIALTGWGQAEDRRRTREAGFDHHFIKPVDPGAVRELLARVLASRGD